MAQSCPVCENEHWSRDVVASRILGLSDRHRVLRCVSCGQRRLDPQLSEAELDQLYSGAYFDLKQAVGGNLSAISAPSCDYVSDVVPERTGKFAKTIRSLKKLNPAAKTLLDVGAATGDLVRIAREEGLAAEGIELSETAIAIAQERNAIKLERLALNGVKKDGFYDCIHLNHVFEHFNDPVKELGHLHRLLAKDGLLYIEIPYQFNLIEKWGFRIRRRQGDFNVHSLHHPYFYTPKSILRLLSKHGFEVIEATVFDESRYAAATLQQKTKRMLWRILAKVSVGNYIEIYARRKPK